MQDPQADQVDREAADRHQQHRQAGDRVRLGEARPGLVEDDQPDPEQEHGVGDGGQDLGAVEPERLAQGGRTGGDPQRPERHPQPDDVRQHVAGIGEQGQRAGEQAADDLGDEVRRCETENHQQSALMRAGRLGRSWPGVRRSGMIVLVRSRVSVPDKSISLTRTG